MLASWRSRSRTRSKVCHHHQYHQPVYSSALLHMARVGSKTLVSFRRQQNGKSQSPTSPSVSGTEVCWRLHTSFGTDNFHFFFSLSAVFSRKQQLRLKNILADGLSEEIYRVGSINGYVGFNGCAESDTDVGLASLVNFTDCGLRDRKWRSR